MDSQKSDSSETLCVTLRETLEIMSFKLTLSLFLIVLIHNLNYSQNVETNSTETERIDIKTKYGNLILVKSCLQNFSYYKSSSGQLKFFGDEVLMESERRKIKEDTVKVLFTTDKNGQIINFRIVSKGKLDKLNEFIEKFCSEVLSQSKINNIHSKLNCSNGNQTAFTIPFNFK